MYKYFAFILAVLALAGCSSGARSVPPRTRPSAAIVPDTLVRPIEGEPGGVLTLPAAIDLAVRSSPQLATFGFEMRAREARIRQAGATPNPVMDFTVEDILGTDTYSGAQQAQTTLQVGQTLEMGGKRDARIASAEAGRDAVLDEFAIARRSVISEVTGRYGDVLIAQERERFARQGVALAERLREVVAVRVSSGKVSPTEETKARIILTRQRVDLDRARHELESSRHRLAATWASSTPRFDSVAGSVDSLLTLPSLDSLSFAINAHTDVTRFESEIAVRRSLVELERSRGVPDITLSGGIRRYEATGDFGAVVGFSMPIPLSDRNEGAVEEAEARVAVLEQERRAVVNRRSALLADRYRTARQAANEARMIRDQLLPDAFSAFEAVREGYSLGRFGLVDVLDAERTLLESRQQYLDALVEYQQARVELQIIVGDAFNFINTDPQK